MRKLELLPTQDCEAGYGPARVNFCSEETMWLLILYVVRSTKYVVCDMFYKTGVIDL